MDYKNINDYEILYLISENDQYRETIFEKYKPILYDICSKYYKALKRCGMEFDDLYQEALIALNKAIDTYDGNSSLFYSYVNVCVNRHLNTFYKSSSTKRKSVLNYSVSLNQVISNDTDSTFEDVISNYNCVYDNVDINLDLINFKNSLNFIESQIFELRWNGFSYNEISLLIDVKVKNVDYYIQKIKRKIRCYF